MTVSAQSCVTENGAAPDSLLYLGLLIPIGSLKLFLEHGKLEGTTGSSQFPVLQQSAL